MKIKNPTKRLKEICKSLGEKYDIRVIDFEQVIYRNFNNGYEVEISGLNNNRRNAKAIIFLWKNRRLVPIDGRICGIDVSVDKLGYVVEKLYEQSQNNHFEIMDLLK